MDTILDASKKNGWIFHYHSMSFLIVADVTTRFDQVFWFGDFNFRLSKPRAEVEAIIKRTAGGDMGPLLEHDQLSKEMKEGMIASL